MTADQGVHLIFHNEPLRNADNGGSGGTTLHIYRVYITYDINTRIENVNRIRSAFRARRWICSLIMARMHACMWVAIVGRITHHKTRNRSRYYSQTRRRAQTALEAACYSALRPTDRPTDALRVQVQRPYLYPKLVCVSWKLAAPSFTPANNQRFANRTCTETELVRLQQTSVNNVCRRQDFKQQTGSSTKLKRHVEIRSRQFMEISDSPAQSCI